MALYCSIWTPAGLGRLHFPAGLGEREREREREAPGWPGLSSGRSFAASFLSTLISFEGCKLSLEQILAASRPPLEVEETPLDVVWKNC